MIVPIFERDDVRSQETEQPFIKRYRVIPRTPEGFPYVNFGVETSLQRLF